MKNSEIITLHTGEERAIKEFGISVQLLHFEEYYPGPGHEELGDQTDIVFLFKQKNERKEVKSYWYTRTFEEGKHFSVFSFEVLILSGSEGFLHGKADSKGKWVKFVVLEKENNESFNYYDLRNHFLRIDYEADK